MRTTPTTLVNECQTLRENLAVARHLADQADEITTMMPLGYNPDELRTKIPRPTEILTVALDDRGVTDLVLTARRQLASASSLVAEAARALDKAISAWEGESR